MRLRIGLWPPRLWIGLRQDWDSLLDRHLPGVFSVFYNQLEVIISMNGSNQDRIDMHVHVGIVGDQWPQWGKLSAWYQQQLVFKVFLLYARIKQEEVCDAVLHEQTIKVIRTCGVEKVVLLALDPVYDSDGTRREDLSHVWVDNEYVLKLREEIGPKVLFGASVHPYDPEFEKRVTECVKNGAALLKWLPSAQQINLADERVPERLEFLATAKAGKPLPLLLHVGPEYAIPSSDPKTHSYDFLRWSWLERMANLLRFSRKWYTPEVDKIHSNLTAGLDSGVVIMFAHCGLPYFASGSIGKLLELSDFDSVRDYLQRNKEAQSTGRSYADVSAFCTPFRKPYFSEVAKLPPQYLLFGSDFPTPAFELSADLNEVMKDFEAVMNGHLDRIIIPQDNLIDVNYRELSHAFPGHPLFTNFNLLL